MRHTCQNPAPVELHIPGTQARAAVLQMAGTRVRAGFQMPETLARAGFQVMSRKKLLALVDPLSSQELAAPMTRRCFVFLKWLRYCLV